MGHIPANSNTRVLALLECREATLVLMTSLAVSSPVTLPVQNSLCLPLSGDVRRRLLLLSFSSISGRFSQGGVLLAQTATMRYYGCC